MLYPMSMVQYLNLDFFCFLLVSFVPALSSLLLSCLLWRLSSSFSIASDEAGCEYGICFWIVSLENVFCELSETWPLTWPTSMWDLSIFWEMPCWLPTLEDWMEQGKTSQRKCMWAGTWAMACGWETEDPETTKAGNIGGPEAGGHNAGASAWWASMHGYVDVCGNSVWLLCCCYRQYREYNFNQSAYLEYYKVNNKYVKFNLVNASTCWGAVYALSLLCKYGGMKTGMLHRLGTFPCLLNLPP